MNALATLTGSGAASTFWSGAGGGAPSGGLRCGVFRLIPRFGGGLVEDEEIEAGGGQNEDQKTTQGGLGDAHRPPPNLS